MEQFEKVTALYCRLAQADDQGIEAQKEKLCQYAEEKGYSNIKIFTDNGYSGLKFDSPAFSEMEEDIQAGKIQTIIIKDFHRIGRDVKKTYDWLERIKTMGIPIVSLTQGTYPPPAGTLQDALHDWASM